MALPIDFTLNPRLQADAVALGTLTNVHSDHMFIAEYSSGQWRKARIQPYKAIPMPPLALGMHYAQIVFEGMKAYKYDDGDVAVFRTEKHHDRFNKSLERMLMPSVSYELFEEAVHTLVSVDHLWVPNGPDSTYYIRPFMIASEERMGLKPADEFLFMVVGGPFRPLYGNHLRVKVERHFTRAAHGGTGYAKCAGNYGGAMYPTHLAKQEGFDQVIWTDAREHMLIEEAGTMNVGFVIDGTIVTPSLTDTILDGVTRASMLQIARDLGYGVHERAVSVDEIRNGLAHGKVTEAFGFGTAASLAPIGAIGIDSELFELPVHDDSIMFKLKAELNSIRFGKVQDRHNWMHTLGVVA
jgi:branched-chain amino acid aminotransferase